jgi:hypothetical protein
MSIIRSYFDKNNTIVSGIKSGINTGRNPVGELFYGSQVGRFIFYIDFGALSDTLTNKSINPASVTKHTLKLKNSSNFDVLPFRDYRDQIQFSDQSHATSFTLELKPIVDEDWDEGIGYDIDIINPNPDEMPYVIGASNWDKRNTQYNWIEAGAVQTGTTALATQHFDKGNEDVEMDITEFVNDVLTGGTTGYTGFCLKFTDYFESLPYDYRKYVTFFSRHTHTFFEPFIETEYNDLVKDDRRNFILDQPCNLVLYTFKKGNLFDLDQLPICSIGGTTFAVNKISKGIYNASVLLSSAQYSDYVMYHDVWSNIIIGGVTQQNVTMDVTPQPSINQYQIGSDTFEPINYGISVSGIKRDEKITQGETRKVLVNLRKPYTVSTVEVSDNIYYRLYVKQGINQIVVVDWTEVNRSFDSNYFFVDTTWLVPQQYFMDIKLNLREETRLFTEELKFSVISQLK